MFRSALVYSRSPGILNIVLLTFSPRYSIFLVTQRYNKTVNIYIEKQLEIYSLLSFPMYINLETED